MVGILDLLKELLFMVGYISSSDSFPSPLAADEEKKALEAMANGCAIARDKLISHNLRLVAHIAKKYNGAAENDELISVGTVGLIKGVNTFDSAKGIALSTYAARCIHNEILMYLRVSKKYRSDVSLSDPIGTDQEGNEITLVDIMGSSQEGVYDQVELKLQTEKLNKIIKKCLSDRERIVITLRYGLTGDKSLSQREVAKVLDISRSYVSRLEKKTLEKLRGEFEKK